MENQANQPQTIIVKSETSMAISIILTFLFGPLGMLYSTVSGGLIMLAISIVIGIFTLGIGFLFTWPVCIIWGAISTNNHNKKLGQQ